MEEGMAWVFDWDVQTSIGGEGRVESAGKCMLPEKGQYSSFGYWLR